MHELALVGQSSIHLAFWVVMERTPQAFTLNWSSEARFSDQITWRSIRILNNIIMPGLVDIGVWQAGSLNIWSRRLNANSFMCRKGFSLSLTTINFGKELITKGLVPHDRRDGLDIPCNKALQN
jgi:hypothetical protein